MPCYFCQHNLAEIDFKESDLLKRFVSGLFKIRSKEKTGTCAKHQRQLKKAIKRARTLGLISSTRN